MALALNNRQRLICHKTKKPNQTKSTKSSGWSFHDILAEVLELDSYSEFESQSHYYIHFLTNTLGKGMNFFSTLRFSLSSTTNALQLRMALALNNQ